MILYKDEPLKKYTYTETGGPADILAFPNTSAQVKALVDYCRNEDIPWIVLGNASNLIVRDRGIRGVVIMLLEMKQIKLEGETIIVESGARLIEVSQVARDASLTGFEFACGIPGSVGGAVFMNAGAYGGEIKDIFVSAEVLLPSGEIITMDQDSMAFRYRHSQIQELGGIVLSSRFALKKGNPLEIKAKMRELTELREAKQPLEYPSCGSVFKRPEGHFTGKLVQDAGLQGYTLGGAQISMKHAGFIVNINQATATDYIQLIAHIQAVIKEKFAVTLEPEVRIIGEE
ncbi:UDP-N-acetylmuramate dehydrogenase [Enterococcus aquimarinus]|nr:UDP-N-acetylmuramate dehydrogenase [Enterococcus aquimarinus]MCC9272734.1 UDP-N-acetylmuramate dehydrogenase [Enterococcus aquimarinus]